MLVGEGGVGEVVVLVVVSLLHRPVLSQVVQRLYLLHNVLRARLQSLELDCDMKMKGEF